LLGIDPKVGSGRIDCLGRYCGWIEFVLLRRSLNQRIGRTGLSSVYIAKLWFSALAGAAIAWAIKLVLPHIHPILVAGLVLVPYGLTYFAVASVLRVSEANAVISRGLRMVGLKR
jgi:putative peptidoglycan lipid II flippase